MAAISQPMIAHEAADSIWRAAKAIHEDNRIDVQIQNIKIARARLQEVADWARKAGTSSYRSNRKVRTQLLSAAGGVSHCITQLDALIQRVEDDSDDVDALIKLMLLRTVIKSISFAPPLDDAEVVALPPDEKTSLDLLRQLGSVESVEPPENTVSTIFGHPAPAVDPLSDEE